MRADPAMRNDAGSGSVLVVAIVAATLLATALIVPLFAAFTVGQSVQNAADAAALAAADTASGRVAGVPCEAAGMAATLGGASVTSCAVDGVIASVSVARSFLGFDVTSRARAGPPDG